MAPFIPVSAVLHKYVEEGHEEGYVHWCPGCKGFHIIRTMAVPYKVKEEGKEERTVKLPCWEFDGNLEKPSFKPSVKVQWNWDSEQQKFKQCCHYYIVAGEIRYENDCTNGMSGKKIPLPPTSDADKD